jgi:colanic acid/amylovoran biosynthesis protein
VHTLGPSAHENDEIAVKEVVNKVQAKERCRIIKDFNLNCYDMMQLYSQCSYFIGTRFHSVIFAQNQNVPTISISYGGNKGTGIMADLGLSQYVLSIDEVEFSTLKNLFSSLEKNTDSYIEKLTERNLLLQEERLKLVTNIRKCLFSN